MEAFLGATALIAGFLGALYQILRTPLGLIGEIIWCIIVVAGGVSLILPLYWFVIFIIMIFKYSDTDLGFILRNIFPYTSDILNNAAEAGWELFKLIWGGGRYQINKNNNFIQVLAIKSRIFLFLNRFCRKTGVLNDLFS
jgi:hypothetical protein